jgi:multiple sugar transport system ATP-binding protein
MASISLRHIYKVYPNGVKAVSDFNMEIHDKEFIVFVGPSGCGKSTTLRMIAGLEDITAGELFIGDTLVNDMEPKDRDVAMVFQNYALYPHMTVYENMAFGLRLRHVPEDEIHRKVIWAAQILKLTDYLDRKPKAMSGGQRQRVALGRAILRNPKVFLLDEPLSNLDAKLRAEMRTEISKLHEALQTTFVYVTHDQVEAMTMGTRIVVMKLGWVQQIDTPKNLYNYPDNKFVAGFIGTPQMNFFDVKLLRKGESVFVSFDGLEDNLKVPFNDMLKVRPAYLNGKAKVTFGIRCENVSIDPEVLAKSKNVLPVKVTHFEELGAETLIYADLNPKAETFGDSSTKIVIKSYKGADGLKIGDVIKVAFDMTKTHFFDSVSEKTIVPRIPETNVFDGAVKNGVLTLLGSQIKLPSGMKCPDVKKADVLIPCDATFVSKGNSSFSAKVTGEEMINDVKVTSLEKDGRTFFLTGEELKVGTTVNLGVDFKRVSIESEGQEIVKPFPAYDTFLGAFTNLENEKVTNRALVSFLEKEKKEHIEATEQEKLMALSAVSYQQILVSVYEKDHKKAVADLKEEQSFRIGTEDVGPEGKRRIHKETKSKIEAENKAYSEKMAALEKQKTEESALSETQKAALEEKKKSIAKPYDEKLASYKTNYDRRIELVKAGVNSMEGIRSEEKEATSEAVKLVKEMEIKLHQDKEALAQEYDVKLKQAQEDFASTSGDEKDKARIKISSLKTEKKNAIKKLISDVHFEEDSVLFSHKKFFAYIDGYGALTSQEINSKIVKSLGLSLFKSQFRYELPHDAYKIVSEGPAIEAVVKEAVDFGGEIYLRCDSNGISFYTKVDKALPVGKKILLSADLTNAHVVENKFDIRLF